MTSQFTFLEPATAELPEGLRYQPELITEREENALLARVRELPFKEFEFHGFKGKRRTVSFGWQYEFSGRGKLHKAGSIPEFLLPLRRLAAEAAGIESEALQHVLVIEYGPGAGIGWHRDRPVFGEVVGISLLAPCMLRFRRKLITPTAPEGTVKSSSGQLSRTSSTTPSRTSSKKLSQWERASFIAEPRSAYYLTGPARWEWQHSLLPVETLRYSITLRTMLEE
jgi:alkylated DNA repair dioxygenase AlkB